MKKRLFKICLFSILFVFSFVLFGCKDENLDLLNKCYDELTAPHIVNKDFTLPASWGEEGKKVTIEWTSSAIDIFEFKLVSNVTESYYDVKVTLPKELRTVDLKATLFIGDLGKEKLFEINVEAGNQNLQEKYDCISIPEAIEIANNAGDTGTSDVYFVYGVIVSVSNPTYGEMTITDGTNQLYVYGTTDNDGNFYNTLANKPVAGDEVVLKGNLKTHKGTPEMGRSIIVEFIHNVPEINPDEYPVDTVANARKAQSGTKLKLTGVVAFITYANGFIPNGFYLVDNTGSIYIYGSDTAQQVSVGNTVSVACEKTYYVNPDESYYAEMYGYPGACQMQSPILVEKNNNNDAFDKTWITETTVKNILESNFENDNITSNIFKVNAQIKKVPGSGFVNYYINDLDGKTGSYTYTACNGADFEWLDKYDGKICTVYLSAINCKSTSAGYIYRFIPILVEENNFEMKAEDYCQFIFEYYVKSQFKNKYESDPSLQLQEIFKNELLGFENTSLEYSVDNSNVLYIENNVLHIKNSGVATVTCLIKYNDYSYSGTIEITVEKSDIPEFISVSEAIQASDESIVCVKGVVAASLVNQTGFYLIDETGVIAVTGSETLLEEVELGNEVIIEGIKIHRKKDPSGAYAGQIVISEATVAYNFYGAHEYSKASFISGKTIKDIYSLDYTKDFSTNVYIVTGKIDFVETPYYTNVNIIGEDGTSLGLYCSSGKQYNFLKEFAGQTVTLEIAPVNWNGKNYYRGCVLSVSDGEKTIINGLNFGK